jgi:hypothetical protein
METAGRGSIGSLLEAIRSPISRDTRARLDDAWRRVPDVYRTPHQFLGRQYAGCGATVGAMPRCDFACQGCYLGEGANRVLPAPLSQIKRQLDALRAWLGRGGNVQLTDGEITLRPADELVELVRYSREIGLVPMLMTHGDGFRRDPELLPRLVSDGGLSEISIHVDTTQRNRRGSAYRHAREERELLPLREEFAALIRRVRRETGRTLEAATTFTVTPDNLASVPTVLRWLCANADAFKMISFQPAAEVGRTVSGLGHRVTVDGLWRKIAEGLSGREEDLDELLRSEGWLGHPSCSRFVQGMVVRDGDRPAVFHPLFRRDDPMEQQVLGRLVALLGGLTFRLDDRAHALARSLGLAIRFPKLAAWDLPRLVLHWAGRFAPDSPLRFMARWLRGEARADYLNVVSHHFMSAAELGTPLGEERLELCAFRVPIEGRLMSMCEANALGGRERYYEGLGRSVGPQGRPTGSPIAGT